MNFLSFAMPTPCSTVKNHQICQQFGKKMKKYLQFHLPLKTHFSMALPKPLIQGFRYPRSVTRYNTNIIILYTQLEKLPSCYNTILLLTLEHMYLYYMKVFRVALVIYDRTLLRKAFLIAKQQREKKKKKNTSTITTTYVLHLTPPPHTHQKSKQNVDCTKMKRSFLIVQNLEWTHLKNNWFDYPIL